MFMAGRGGEPAQEQREKKETNQKGNMATGPLKVELWPWWPHTMTNSHSAKEGEGPGTQQGEGVPTLQGSSAGGL